MTSTPTIEGARLVPEESKERRLLLGIRQALIIALGAIEDYLQLDRSITPKHKR